MDKSKSWLLVIGILVIVAWGMMAAVNAISEAAARTLQPIQDLQEDAGDLGTQVADFLNPTPTILPDPVVIVHDVRALARMETVQYSIERVITAETGQGIFGSLFGDKLLFVAHGIVIAGTDMQKLQPEDLWVVDGVLYVRLPAPEVFIATLDNEKSYVYDRETGLLTKGDVNLETEARKAAEDAILESALEDGILETARQNAELYFSLLFRDLGFPAVIFVDP
jgi:hypothetical protein